MGALVVVSMGAMVGLAVLFALVLAAANRRLQVQEDTRVSQIMELLPGANCGACGYASCRMMAEALVKGEAAPQGCAMAGADAQAHIAAVLGVENQAREVRRKRYARVWCGAELNQRHRVAIYQGEATCQAAHLTAGGGMVCPYGCLGYGDCVASCPFNALSLVNGVPRSPR